MVAALPCRAQTCKASMADTTVVTLVVAGVTVAQQRVTFRHQQEVTSAEVAV